MAVNYIFRYFKVLILFHVKPVYKAVHIRTTYVTGFTKLTIMSQELKSELCPNINDSLMHYPRTSTAWV